MPKILCLTSHNLDGPDYGASLRCRNLFKLLAKFGEVDVALVGSDKFWGSEPKPTCGGFKLLHAVHLQPTPPHSLRDRLRLEFNPRFQNVFRVQAAPADREWLQATVAKYDLVWIHSLQIANGAGLWRWPNSILDVDDVPSTYYQSLFSQAVNPVDKLRWRRQIFLWRRHEKTLHERFDAICVCSELDRRLLDGSGKVFAVPNGFDAPEKPPVRQPVSPPRIGFVGTFVYEPNRKGVRWFVEKVWPLILKKMPQAKLRLAGDRSDQGDWQSYPNVEPLGWIADSDGEMATWSLSVVPVSTGGGTRIKIAATMSRKCPVVSTSLGAYGYDVTDGGELFLADTPEAFAEKCLRILANPDEGRRLAENGWKKFNGHWTWDKQADRLAAAVKMVLRDSSPEVVAEMTAVPVKTAS